MNLDHPLVTISHVTETTPLALLFLSTEVKAHLRIDFSDAGLTMVQDSAVELVESHCNCKFGVQTWAAYWDYEHPIVHIPKFGPKSLVTFEKLNAAGTYETVPADNYEIDTNTNPMRVLMKTYETEGKQLNRYKLSFTTTIPKESIPNYVKQAVLMIIAHYFENRQDSGYRRVHEVPMNSQYLLQRYREQSFV